MDSGSLPGGSAYDPAEPASHQRLVALGDDRPSWLTFSPDEVAMFLACIADIESNRRSPAKEYDVLFLTNVKRILSSSRPLRLSAKQVDYILHLRDEALPAAAQPVKKAIVDAAMDVLEDAISHIDWQIRLLRLLKEDKLFAAKQKLANVEGGLSIHDFAERALKIYCKFPDLSFPKILTIFGGDATSISDIPQRYRAKVWMGALCERCNEKVYIRDIKEFRKTGVYPSRTCQDCDLKQQSEAAVLKTESHSASTSQLPDSDFPTPFWKAVETVLSAGLPKEPVLSDRQRQLDTITYAEYLQTEEWAVIRRNAYTRAGYRCQICGDRNHLNVHHNRYPRRRGTEEPWDLCVLCEDCHTANHEVLRQRRERDTGFGKSGDSYHPL